MSNLRTFKKYRLIIMSVIAIITLLLLPNYNVSAIGRPHLSPGPKQTFTPINGSASNLWFFDLEINHFGDKGTQVGNFKGTISGQPHPSRLVSVNNAMDLVLFDPQAMNFPSGNMFQKEAVTASSIMIMTKSKYELLGNFYYSGYTTESVDVNITGKPKPAGVNSTVVANPPNRIHFIAGTTPTHFKWVVQAAYPTGSRFLRISDMTSDALGNVYVAGIYSGDQVTFGGQTLPDTNNLNNYFIAKIVSQAGGGANVSWVYTGQSPNFAPINNIKMNFDLKQNVLIVAGDISTGAWPGLMERFFPNLLFKWNAPSIGATDVVYLYMDPAGQPLYINVIGSSGNDYLADFSANFSQALVHHSAVRYDDTSGAQRTIYFPDPAGNHKTLQVSDGREILVKHNQLWPEIIKDYPTRPIPSTNLFIGGIHTTKCNHLAVTYVLSGSFNFGSAGSFTSNNQDIVLIKHHGHNNYSEISGVQIGDSALLNGITDIEANLIDDNIHLLYLEFDNNAFDFITQKIHDFDPINTCP